MKDKGIRKQPELPPEMVRMKKILQISPEYRDKESLNTLFNYF